MRCRILAMVALLAILAAVLWGCGEKETPYETNLLRNGSFEQAGSDGIPEHWEIALFRGLEGEDEARYGIDNTTAADGANSFSFSADLMTRRWFLLSQEVEVKDVTHVRLEGWIQTEQVNYNTDQFAQANLFLTFYDENHARFQDMRRTDRQTRAIQGTHLWFKEDMEFRLPVGTRYVEVGCILGMDGRAWFDNISLSVPKPIEWETRETENFVFHWMPGYPPPEGAIENQQLIFNHFESRLGLDSDVVVKYYLYPDTASIRGTLGVRGYQYTSWDDREFHSINPNDNHEVVHFMTDQYGRPPRSIAEGTVFWLQGNWRDVPVDQLAAHLLAHDQLPLLRDLITYNSFTILDPNIGYPSAAAFVKFLVVRYGPEKLMELYTALNGVNSYNAFAPAFEQVYGISASDAEEAFRVVLSGLDSPRLHEGETSE